MSNPIVWTEDYLLSLIRDRVQENIQLDYKASEALQNNEKKKTEISKDVSAFANSAGGVIIYGIAEEGSVPTAIDEGLDPAATTKEWIEQIINSRIQRKIDGLRIVPVELHKTSPGRVAFVVEIPQSLQAPHQASDKRFYKRYNFQSVPMEEYEVRDTANRFSGPRLSIAYDLHVGQQQLESVEESGLIRNVEILPVITNTSPTPAKYISIHLMLDDKLAIRDVGGGFTKQSDLLVETEQGVGACCSVFHSNHAVPHKMPVYEGLDFRLCDDPIRVKIPDFGKYVLAYQVSAPYMAVEKRVSLLVATPGSVSIVAPGGVWNIRAF